MEYKKQLADLTSVVVRESASDLHLSVGRNPIIRVSGFLIPLLKMPLLTEKDLDGFLDEILSPENKKTFLETKEIDFSYAFAESARFRGNGFYQRGVVGVALRLIPQEIRTLQELNLPAILESFTQKAQGFFLVV